MKEDVVVDAATVVAAVAVVAAPRQKCHYPILAWIFVAAAASHRDFAAALMQ